MGNIVYKDPIQEANKISAVLRNDEKCDYIICLSHLGYKYENNKVSDIALANASLDIDLIIGGHAHLPWKALTAQQMRRGKRYW